MKRDLKKIWRLHKIRAVFVLFLLILGCYKLFQDGIRNVLKGNGHERVDETMHLVGVSCGRLNHQGMRDIRKPMDLTITMIKSAAVFAQAPLHIHIFTEDDMVSIFETELEGWPEKILSRVSYTIRTIDYANYLSKPISEVWKKWYKPCGSFRLLLPMILKEVTDAAIYSDSDVVFIKPIDQLWDYLKQMNSRQLAAISPTAGHPLGGSPHNENFISHSTGLFQINSGVMVMNFSRMLKTDWLLYYDEKSAPQIEAVPKLKYGTELLLNYYKKYEDSAEHDQKLLNIMFHYNPELIQQLSCTWNFKNNFCQDDKNICEEAEKGEGAGAVHGITSVFFGDGNPTFRALYEAFLEYDFEEDIQSTLLDPFLKQLKQTASGSYCWSKSHVITGPLKRSIKQLIMNNN